MAAQSREQEQEQGQTATDQAINHAEVAAQALALFNLGILSFPASAKAKHPDRVKEWKANAYPGGGQPSRAEHEAMFHKLDVERLFIVCGKRSGGVGCFDFDQEGFFAEWRKLIPATLFDRLYVEQSQRSGGYHVAFKVTGDIATCQPARDPRKDDGSDGKVRIEVRGEGNGFIAAPSVGYQRVQGDLTQLPTLTEAEYQILMDAAAKFNECAPRPVVEPKPRVERPADADELPGDRFNRENGQAEVLAMFQKNGWTIGNRGGGNVDIARPGASSETSGNVNADGVAHIFSTNTAFESSASGLGKPHSPFAVLTTLEHGGDYRAAGKALAAMYAPRPVHKPRVAGATRVILRGSDELPPLIETAPAQEPIEGQATPFRATTDFGNAERLIDRFGDSLRYSKNLGWLVWNGRYWEQDEIGRVMAFAKRTVRDMLGEAGDTEDYEKRKALAKWAIRSESAAALMNMVELAKTEPEVPVMPVELDTNPWLLTVANGTLNLQTGVLGPHRREDLITKGSAVKYDPEARCPLFEAFVHRIMEGDATRVRYIQRALGYSMTGDTSERKIFIPYGKGKNGKSTLLSIISELAGDFALRTPTETLMQKRNEGVPNNIAQLRGARFVYASEAEDGKRLAESLIKDLTGEERISARFMRQEWFTFQPTFKIWFSTNHRPEIKGTDDAIWDRVRLIPFNVRFSEAEQRPRYQVMEEFRAEMPGILNWLVKGCTEWWREGLGECEAVNEATAEYRTEMDALGAWIKEECKESPLDNEAAGTLYDDYKRWADNSGEKAATAKQFAAQLAERGFQKKRVTKGISYGGIRIKTAAEKEGNAG